MKIKAVSVIMLTLLFVSMLTLAFNVQPVKAESKTIIVPDDHEKIQWAIGNASAGDTIFVKAGTYYEHVVVNKPLTLSGENPDSTIIDGNGTGNVLIIIADHVTIRGFTTRNGGQNAHYKSGIYLCLSDYCTITNNIASNSTWGICIYRSSENQISNNKALNNFHGMVVLFSSCNNSITGNTLFDNSNFGIYLQTSCNGNDILYNLITSNKDGIMVHTSHNNRLANNQILNSAFRGIGAHESSNNRIYHNNFINYTEQVFSYDSLNIWDDGYPSGGNYWSDYADVDLCNGPNQDLLGMDGIWDHPYVIDADNKDRYPLVKPYPTIPVTVDIDPDTLNLKSKGQWITAYIELPEGYDVSDIDVSTVMLNDTIPISLLDVPAAEPIPTEIGDYDEDGIPDLMVKFDRTLVESYIYYTQGITYGDVALTITGELFDGTPFEGTDIIFVNYAGDANNDGIIGISDMGVVSDHWYPGPPTGICGYSPDVDFNKDGKVGIFDMGIVSDNWGQTTPTP